MTTKIPNLVRWRNALLMSGEVGPKPTVRATLLTLSVRANIDNLTFYMPVSELAEWMGVNKRTAERYLSDALESGWLVQLRRGNSGGNASAYRLSLGATENPDGVLKKKNPTTVNIDGGLPTELTVDYRQNCRGSTVKTVGPTVKTVTTETTVFNDEPDF